MSKWKEYKEELGDTRPWELLNPNAEWASEEEAERRYSVCKLCPELISLTKQCKQCGCIMSAKTKLLKASCPLNKW